MRCLPFRFRSLRGCPVHDHAHRKNIVPPLFFPVSSFLLSFPNTSIIPYS